MDDEPVKLTPIEYNILLLLVKNQGRVFSINQIYESIWEKKPSARTIRWRYISGISGRRSRSIPKEPRYLKVVWGVGYKIEKQ